METCKCTHIDTGWYARFVVMPFGRAVFRMTWRSVIRAWASAGSNQMCMCCCMGALLLLLLLSGCIAPAGSLTYLVAQGC
jgi:hypothetical protein